MWPSGWVAHAADRVHEQHCCQSEATCARVGDPCHIPGWVTHANARVDDPCHCLDLANLLMPSCLLPGQGTQEQKAVACAEVNSTDSPSSQSATDDVIYFLSSRARRWGFAQTCVHQVCYHLWTLFWNLQKATSCITHYALACNRIPCT